MWSIVQRDYSCDVAYALMKPATCHYRGDGVCDNLCTADGHMSITVAAK